MGGGVYRQTPVSDRMAARLQRRRSQQEERLQRPRLQGGGGAAAHGPMRAGLQAMRTPTPAGDSAPRSAVS